MAAPDEDQFAGVSDMEQYRIARSMSRHPSASPFAMGTPKRLRTHMVRAHGMSPEESRAADPESLSGAHRMWHQTFGGSFDHEH